MRTELYGFWTYYWWSLFDRDARELLELTGYYVLTILLALAIWRVTTFTVERTAYRMKVNTKLIWTLIAILALTFALEKMASAQIFAALENSPYLSSYSHSTVATADDIYTLHSIEVGEGSIFSTIVGTEGSGSAMTVDLGEGYTYTVLNTTGNGLGDEDSWEKLENMLILQTRDARQMYRIREGLREIAPPWEREPHQDN